MVGVKVAAAILKILTAHGHTHTHTHCPNHALLKELFTKECLHDLCTSTLTAVLSEVTADGPQSSHLGEMPAVEEYATVGKHIGMEISLKQSAELTQHCKAIILQFKKKRVLNEMTNRMIYYLYHLGKLKYLHTKQYFTRTYANKKCTSNVT